MIYIDAAIAIFEAYVFVSFFFRTMRLKPGFSKWIAPMLIIYIAGMIVLSYVKAPPIIFLLFMLIGCYSFSLLFSAPISIRIIYPILLVTLDVLVEALAGFWLMISTGTPIDEIIRTSELYFAGGIATKLMFFAIVRLICRYQHRNDAAMPLRFWLGVMCVPVVSISVMSGFALEASNMALHNSAATILILAGILAINAFAFLVYDRLSMQSKALLEHQQENARLEYENLRYSSLVKHSEDLSALVHDNQKHLDILSTLIDGGKTDDASEYLHRLSARLTHTHEEEVVPFYPALDALVREKVAIAENSGITMDCSVMMPPLIPIDPVDFCIIVGNAMDNAIEACLKVKGKRNISLQMYLTGNRLIISVTNSSPPVNIKDGHIETTKTDEGIHGYGMASINKAVKKYDGNMLPLYRDNEFRLHILILL